MRSLVVSYDDIARRAVAFAHEEGASLGFVATEHILVGLLRAGGGVSDAMVRAGLTAPALRLAARGRSGPPQRGMSGAFTAVAHQALYDALRISREDARGRVRSEHLLRAIVADPRSRASRCLARLGVEPRVLLERMLAPA